MPVCDKDRERESGYDETNKEMFIIICQMFDLSVQSSGLRPLPHQPHGLFNNKL